MRPSRNTTTDRGRGDLPDASSRGGTIAWGLSWHITTPVRTGIVLLAVTALLLGLPRIADADRGEVTSVIVVEAAAAGDQAERVVTGAGGAVTAQLGLINGFAADVPASAIPSLRATPGVVSVTRDTQVTLLGGEDPYLNDDGITARPELVLKTMRAERFWNAGYSGAGVDVAVIDSGVVPVEGLSTPGKVINGADLSFESQSDDLRYMDTYGHGTHIAGIIAGRDSDAPPADQRDAKSNRYWYLGIAPDARIVNVKVADAEGNVDVSQVIAAVDWVVQHRNANGMNIRVLNLSFGTDGVQDYQLDPLAFAVEQAWKQGIVVVVAGGNDGNASQLRNPAVNPFVIAVGAVSTGTSHDTKDDYVPSWTSCGTTSRHVDIVAPGVSVLGLRNPGSTIDGENPHARVGDRFFKGSGSSQASAVVAGLTALIVQQRPDITPDEVKALFTDHGKPIKDVSPTCQGSGVAYMEHLKGADTPSVSQHHGSSSGTGSLRLARGSNQLVWDDDVLDGDVDIFGNPFDSAGWATASAGASSWSGGEWNGASWSGASWSGASWSGASWSGASWSGASWSGASWSGLSWSGLSWSGASWSGASWSGLSWSSASWSSGSWSASFWG
jgi:serine protease AprX